MTTPLAVVADEQPVKVNATISLVLMVIAPLLVKYGVSQDAATEVLTTGLGIAAGCVAIWRQVVTHRKVTPLAKPRNDAGEVLVPVGKAA